MVVIQEKLEASQCVKCAASKDPAVRLFILGGMLIAFGAWCFNDAFLAGKYDLPEAPKINDLLTYWFNHGGAVAFPVLGIIPLAMGVLSLRRKVVADAEGIGYVGKAAILWSAVTKMDTSRWKSKGILVLHASDGRKFTLDEWKLDKRNFRDLIAMVERHVAPAEEKVS